MVSQGDVWIEFMSNGVAKNTQKHVIMNLQWIICFFQNILNNLVAAKRCPNANRISGPLCCFRRILRAHWSNNRRCHPPTKPCTWRSGCGWVFAVFGAGLETGQFWFFLAQSLTPSGGIFLASKMWKFTEILGFPKHLQHPDHQSIELISFWYHSFFQIVFEQALSSDHAN